MTGINVFLFVRDSGLDLIFNAHDVQNQFSFYLEVLIYGNSKQWSHIFNSTFVKENYWVKMQLVELGTDSFCFVTAQFQIMCYWCGTLDGGLLRNLSGSYNSQKGIHLYSMLFMQ